LPTKTIASIVLCAALSCATGVAADETDDLTAQGGQLIQQLAGALQTELVAAMQSGGPVAAVDVCNHQAFDITYNVSDAAEGWEISRSSHRLRNPANTPDEYTAAAMDVLLSRAADGETPQTLVTAEIVERYSRRIHTHQSPKLKTKQTSAITVPFVFISRYGAWCARIPKGSKNRKR